MARLSGSCYHYSVRIYILVQTMALIYDVHFNSGHNVSLICATAIENIISNNINQVTSVEFAESKV